MATNKQRIQTYIDQQLFDSFEAERLKWDVSQSQALERILAERYNVKVQASTSYPIEIAIESQNSSDYLIRFEAEIRGMVTLNRKYIEQIFIRLDNLEEAVGELFQQIPESNNSNSESEVESPEAASGNSNSESEGESPEAASGNSKSESEGESPNYASNHPFFDRLIICNVTVNGEVGYWTGERFSPDQNNGIR